ncbi:MAG: hypothetical protein MK135_06010, partial [Polyangiaceae bacterium]|nr:hypothetical protein [Polyangiaceae bacterium]
MTIVMDHEDGYSSRLTGLSRVNVAVGDELPSHFHLGELRTQKQVGVSRPQNFSELEILLLHDGQEVDAHDWFGL